ncbi:MAG: hypothetical protein HOP31_12415 [Ignavibacteria bacterium]|nr:hypothetical protein [Ignavibacteria bacterium]
MQTTKIRSNSVKNTEGKDKSKLPADKRIVNGNFREKLSEMINNSGTAEKLKAVEKISENTVKLGFEKAVAHFENPGFYPLPSEGRNLENAVFNLLNALPKKKRNKMIDKVNELLKAPMEKRKQVYGDIVNVNFRSSESIAEQVKKIPVLKKYSLSAEELDNLKNSYKDISANFNGPVPEQAAASTRLSFIVDNMTCNNPDDVLKDEISIAGFIIDSLGNTTELAPRFISKFRKDETVNLGANSRLFTVNIDPFLAQQTFAANLFIIESDLVGNREALDNLILVLSIIAFTLSLVALGIVIAGSLGAAVTFTQFFITFFSAVGLGIITRFLPLIGDDISNITTDTLIVDGILGVGTEFARTIEIGKGFDIASTFDGKYSAAARWIGEA